MAQGSERTSWWLGLFGRRAGRADPHGTLGRLAAEAFEAIGTADGDLEEAAMMPIRISRGSTVPTMAKTSP